MALSRARRRLLVLWIIIAVVVWNGVWDMQMHDAVRGSLLQAALFQAHLGPGVHLQDDLHYAAGRALAISSAWALGIFAAGLFTIIRAGDQRR
ncbi:MAG TPA: hypothetical protein VFX12_03650 [Vicinamibacterales bacterium]|nr:hypothetical protein [Vicinamibacterales bacterium]